MIDLYILKNCPFCKKVLNYLDTTDIEYRTLDISSSENAEVLRRIGGVEQVPFLLDKERNVQMYESDDIINYLKTL